MTMRIVTSFAILASMNASSVTLSQPMVNTLRNHVACIAVAEPDTVAAYAVSADAIGGVNLETRFVEKQPRARELGIVLRNFAHERRRTALDEALSAGDRRYDFLIPDLGRNAQVGLLANSPSNMGQIELDPSFHNIKTFSIDGSVSPEQVLVTPNGGVVVWLTKTSRWSKSISGLLGGLIGHPIEVSQYTLHLMWTATGKEWNSGLPAKFEQAHAYLLPNCKLLL